MDATERIKSLLEQRGWTAYRLSKNCGLSENTIATILKRNSLPSVGTLLLCQKELCVLIAAVHCFH